MIISTIILRNAIPRRHFPNVAMHSSSYCLLSTRAMDVYGSIESGLNRACKAIVFDFSRGKMVHLLCERGSFLLSNSILLHRTPAHRKCQPTESSSTKALQGISILFIREWQKISTEALAIHSVECIFMNTGRVTRAAAKSPEHCRLYGFATTTDGMRY